jgi:protein gp37
MAKNTRIAWTDDTYNLWWGCTPRGPGCANCYASALAKRYGHDVWGAKSPRRILSERHARDLDQYQRLAVEQGASRRVFVGSMMDLAEERPDTAPLVREFLASVERYPALDFLILTKRPEHYRAIFRDAWPSGRAPANVWIGATVVLQSEADRTAPILAELALEWGASAAFLSIEPQLESLRIPAWTMGPGGITWLITGGESGGRVRPYDDRWAAEIIADARGAGIAPFVKQLGTVWARAHGLRGKADDPSKWPEELRVQEFPLPRRPIGPTSQRPRRQVSLPVVGA